MKASYATYLSLENIAWLKETSKNTGKPQTIILDRLILAERIREARGDALAANFPAIDAGVDEIMEAQS